MTMNDPNHLRGKRALLVGLGSRQGGLGVARYLVESGAEVRVTDLRDEAMLAATLDDLKGLPIRYTFGQHDDDDFHWADVIIRNPAVPQDSPWLRLARDLGKRVEMEMTLFFRACPAPIVGVTGTKGKTTTTSLLSAILRERWPNSVLAGNMGRSALMQLPSIQPDVPVAIELSSFQLEALDEHRMAPHVGVITNISPDHLDRYASVEEYAWVKGAIGRHQQEDDWLVVPGDDPLVRHAIQGSRSERIVFAPSSVGAGLARDMDLLNRPMKPASTVGAKGVSALWIDDGRFTGVWNGERVALGSTKMLRLPGEHSQLNALAAAGAALAAGVTPEQIQRAISVFSGVPHRLEHVATINGVDYINDTTATAPAAGVAGLRAFAGRDVIVISGGYDKQIPMEPYADELVRSARCVVLLEGTVTPEVISMLRERGYDAIEGPYDSMRESVRCASEVAKPGSVVLLSPGCASFGLFRDEFHRGEVFREAVHEMAEDSQDE